MNLGPLELNRCHTGDARELLRLLPDESVQCCVTSIPYFGLRSYGSEPVVWGAANGCAHEWGESVTKKGGGGQPGEKVRWQHTGEGVKGHQAADAGNFCSLCGAWRGELGLEPTPGLYVQHVVEVFREVRRVLRPDGVCWINVGDSYSAGGRGSSDHLKKKMGRKTADAQSLGRKATDGLAPKNLVGIPWRVAFALQQDGWFLRSAITWVKENPIPESVLDRPTKATEMIFLLSKNERYFYDGEAVKEPCRSGPSDIRKMVEQLPRIGGKYKDLLDPLSKANSTTNIGHKRAVGDPAGRNLRDWWLINTVPFRGAHFAVFPPEIPRRCILAGSSPRACVICGSPWVRVVERTDEPAANHKGSRFDAGKTVARAGCGRTQPGDRALKRTTGWAPTCSHHDDSGRCVILDPFVGSGTTGKVAEQLGRWWIGFDIQPAYEPIQRRRTAQRGLLGYREGGP